MRDLPNRITHGFRSVQTQTSAGRLIRLTEELQAIQQQLQWSTFQHLSRSEQDRLLQTLLNTGLVESLKSAADRLSQFLWCYIEWAAQNCSDEEVDYGQQSINLGQATETLRLLHFSSSLAQDPIGFMDRITRTVNRHLQPGEQRSDVRLERSA